MSSNDDPEDEVHARVIEALLDESLEGFERFVSPDELLAIRMCLHDELTLHPDGRAMVRAAMEDPRVGASGTVAKDQAGATATRPKKRGLGS